MINTSSKTLGAQEIKQSPSMKIGTKPYARSQRNELAEATGRWKHDRMLDRWLSRQATGRKDRTLAATDQTQERSVRSSTERFQARETTTRRVRWQATERWQRPIGSSRLQRSGRPDASGRDDSASGQQQICGSSTPTATFSVGLINTTPNRPFEVCGAEETYQGC